MRATLKELCPAPCCKGPGGGARGPPLEEPQHHPALFTALDELGHPRSPNVFAPPWGRKRRGGTTTEQAVQTGAASSGIHKHTPPSPNDSIINPNPSDTEWLGQWPSRRRRHQRHSGPLGPVLRLQLHLFHSKQRPRSHELLRHGLVTAVVHHRVLHGHVRYGHRPAGRTSGCPGGQNIWGNIGDLLSAIRQFN
ncbi:unnamed protein product [Lota lota]